MENCKRIAWGTCKKCSACGNDCQYYIPEEKKEEKNQNQKETLGYGYGIWGGRIVDILPHGARYYINGGRK
jgi:hypothetical protein